jgi:hypothetical protein
MVGTDTTFASERSRRGLLRPLTTTRGWQAMTHHLLGLPLGLAYFTWLVTGLAVGAGLGITIVGLPILTLVLASVRPLLAAERTLANTLLGTDLPRAGLAPRGDGWLGKLKAYWTDATTWRGIGYLLARFPLGTLAFTAVTAAYSAALFLITAPVVAPFDTIELGIWQPDTWFEGLALVPAGLVLLVAAGWISEGLAAMSRGLAHWGTK